MLLLTAMISLRRVRSISVEVPPGTESDKCLSESLNWLQSSATKTIQWGEDLNSQYDDWCYIEFLEYCELRFHELLSKLESPLAPFLRLEQLASLTHFSCHRMLVLSHINPLFPTAEETYKIMERMLDAALAIASTMKKKCDCEEPWGLSPSPIICREPRWHEFMDKEDDEIEALPLFCAASRYCRRWHQRREERDDDLFAQPKRQPKAWQDKEPPKSETSEGCRESEQPDIPQADLDDAEESAFEHCSCLDRPWRQVWYSGIHPYKDLLQTPRCILGAESVPPQLRDFDFGYI